MTDGTVVWEIWAEQAKVNDCYNFTNDCDTCVASGMYAPIVNSNNSPYADFAGRMLVISRNRGEGYTQQIFFSTSPSNEIYSRIRRTGVWTPWEQQEAIVAKSLGANGYIKYASGLIVQWGTISNTPNGESGTVITFPISFTSTNITVVATLSSSNSGESGYIRLVELSTKTTTSFKAWVKRVTSGSSISYETTKDFNWIAIGY